MLKGRLLHPEILRALGGAGHGSRVLISDGNFPHSTRRGPNAQIVWANFSAGVLGAEALLDLVAGVVPLESVVVMDTLKTGPYAMAGDPPIWQRFRTVLRSHGSMDTLERLERTAFYEAASGPDVCLTIASGETAIYANLLLTIGVVRLA